MMELFVSLSNSVDSKQTYSSAAYSLDLSSNCLSVLRGLLFERCYDS